jgi:hypothetical protein
MRLAALLLASTLAAACGAEEDPILTEAELQAGGARTDGTGFIDVADGADAELVAGAQGGFHVWVNVRVHGAAGALGLVREARRVEDGELVLLGLEQPLEVPEDAMTDWWESPRAVPSFMCPTPIGIGIVDRPIRITVQLTSETDELLGEDEVTVTPRCPTGDGATWCHDICSG